MPKDILLICGSLNQTTMMHQIAKCLSEHNTYFTPFYADRILNFFSQRGFLDFSILGGQHRKLTDAYLEKHNLPVDFRGSAREYDTVITCTDTLIQQNIRDQRLILVQEGMTEPEGMSYHLVKRFNLPRYLADTAATGLSDRYDLFCVASKGYRDLFISKGARPEKIFVTGIPNFDNVESYLENDFPHHDYVLAATSAARETFKRDNRKKFIRWVLDIADGSKVIFKLHPNEKIERSTNEIKKLAPNALIFQRGNINHMIANCSVLVTQFTSATFIGIALGKEVHTYLNLERLRQLLPLQNGGKSAERIASLCQQLLNLSPQEIEAARSGKLTLLRRFSWKTPEAV